MSGFEPELMHPSDQIVLVIDRIYKRGLTTTSGGNISIIEENGDIWVTPSGVDKGALQRDDIVCVKKDGTKIGKHKPSSEFPFHRAIYECRPDITAIIHAHPPALVSFSVARQVPDTNIIPQARNICGPIGYAPYALPGSRELGESIADPFRENYDAVIMENHGTVVGGTDLKDAFQRFETLEFSARTMVNGKTIGNPVYLSDEDIENFEDQIPRRQPEMESVAHPADERDIRESIVEMVKRACEQGLMISSYGTLSVRWRDDDFLITPTEVSRWDIRREDIVQIRDGRKEPGKLPSRGVWLHQEIYRRNPEVNSIILTQSPYLMAFGVTGEKFDVRTIPESWIFLQDVPNVSFGSHFRDKDTIPELIAKGTSCIIIENDSVLVTGNALLDAFDRLEVAEFSARSLTMSKPLGELHPINEQQISELENKFLS